MRERVTGSDGIYRLAAHCATQGYRPYFLGAAPGVADTVAERLMMAHPELEVAGAYAGSPDPQDEDDIIARVREAAPDLLLSLVETTARTVQADTSVLVAILNREIERSL